MMDYQALAIQKMPQKAKNKLDDETLSGVMKALFGNKIEAIHTVAKIKEDAWELQWKTH